MSVRRYDFWSAEIERWAFNWSMNSPTGATPQQLVINTRPAGQPISHDYGSYFGEYSNQYSGVGGPRVLQLAVSCIFSRRVSWARGASRGPNLFV